MVNVKNPPNFENLNTSEKKSLDGQLNLMIRNKYKFISYNGIRNEHLDMLSKNKKIYICGLDGDFNRNKFGTLLDLIPLCDKVNKLTAMCSLCKNGTPGIFSLRLSTETDQTIIGSENYIPVCRKCYNNRR